jgi:hypothetical protein
LEALFRTIVPPYRLGELLLRIGERRLTGRLLLSSDLGERTVYFHTGLPVFAHSSQFSERLGAVGVRYGIVKREEVARALALAREQGTEIGRALLELGHVNGVQLFRLLGAQLLEQLAASCGSVAARARFYVDPGALTKVAILRVHPMTAVLAAVRHMPALEHTKMLGAVSERRVAQLPLPGLVLEWLSDLGYVGDTTTLTAGEATTVGVIRSRLVAKLRASTQQDFDPTASPVHIDARKEDSGRPAARSVADYITLAMLLCGAIKLGDSSAEEDRSATAAAAGTSDTGGRADTLPNTAQSVQATLNGALHSPLCEVPAAAPPHQSAADAAIRAYLREKRETRTAARMAIWGPAAELEDSAALSQLLTLYLTLKPEASDAAVLGVEPGDAPTHIADAYATYQRFLEEFGEQTQTPLTSARIAELRERIDAALIALAPDLLPPSAAHVPLTADESAQQPPAPASTPGAESAPQVVQPHAGVPAEQLDPELLLQNVEARVREGNWQKVLELIEPWSRGRALPPALSLSRALAERELARQPLQRRSKRALALAFVVGGVAGWFAHQLLLARGYIF